MSQQTVLVLNCGSSSLKFAIIDANSGQTYLSGLAESLSTTEAQVKWQSETNKETIKLPNADHQIALQQLVDIIKQQNLVDNLTAVGHRVVHGGEGFVSSVVIDEEVLNTIEDMAKLAPLHNPANVLGINAAQAAFPTLPQVAVFDTAFHQSMPEHAYLYALPYELYQEHGIRRYGFHGTSHDYVARKAAEYLKQDLADTNLITAHLGNGSSITAIKNGKSVDTSMGLTPLEGLVMGTRSGDIDPGIFNYLSSQLKMSTDEINTLLNKKSGLLGLSQISHDCRELQEAMDAGNAQAKLTLDIFCYRIAKYIASYTVPLGSLDALVFTGGIGENSAYVRETVINLLKIFNFKLDPTGNQAARFGQSGLITSQDSPKALVIPTNEEWMIAQDAYSLTH